MITMSSLLLLALLLPQCLSRQAILGSFLPLQGQPSGAYHSSYHLQDKSTPFDARFVTRANKALRRLHVPGLAIAVVDGDEVHAKGFGFAKYPDTLASPDTLWYTGSTTKAFTAAAVSLLVDNKTVEWTTPLSQVIRDEFVMANDYATTHITLEDALSHRTGLPLHDLSRGRRNATTPADTVRGLRHLPLTAEPRTRFQYSNIMFVTVGYAIERLTCLTLGDFWHNFIWTPLGMISTYSDLESARDSPHDLAQGYAWDDDTQQYLDVPPPPSGIAGGAGSIISNVIDYSKWLRMMIHRKAPISEAGHAALLLPRTIIGPDQRPHGTGDPVYTLGWSKRIYRGQLLVSHDGGMFGFGSTVMYLPDRQWGVVIMANTMESSNAVALSLANNLIDDLLGVPENDRFDWLHRYEEDRKSTQSLFEHAKHRLFPSVPSPPILAALPLSAYQDRYTHAAYPTLTLRAITTKSNSGESGVLRGFLDNVLLRLEIELEHVSGEYWLASLFKIDDAGRIWARVRGEFQLNAQGQVVSLGLELDETMAEKGEKIWLIRED